MAGVEQSVVNSRTLRVLVTLACVGVLILLVDFGDVFERLTDAKAGYLVAAVSVAVCDRVVMIGKWVPLLRKVVPGIGLSKAVRAYIASGIGLYLLPVSVGADVLRATALGVGRDRLTEVSVSIVVERVIGLAAMGLICIGSLLVGLQLGVDLALLVPWAVLAAVVGFGVLAGAMSNTVLELIKGTVKRIKSQLDVGNNIGVERLNRIGQAFQKYRNEEMRLLVVGIVTMAEQLIPAITMWLIGIALGLDLPFLVLVVVMPLALFVARLPISLGGIGIAEGAIVYLLSLFGVAVGDAVALALVGRLVDVIVVAIPGAILWHELVPEDLDSVTVNRRSG